MTPIRTVHAAAPIRVCDNGGWTDTWVARQGAVFNIAVRPLVNVRVDVFPAGTRESRVMLDARDLSSRYAVSFDPDGWGPHPLLEAAIRRIRPPDTVDVEIAIHSDAPAGASTGTSAAVTVALLGALDRVTGGARSAEEIARAAHAVESEDLGQQSGVQDQLAAAFGGINFIEITDYPRATVTPLNVGEHVIDHLNRRFVLIYFGRPHHSSAVHEKVVRDLERRGRDCPPLQALRRAAVSARDAALDGDLDRFGRALQDNTEAQADLHPDLVSREAWRIIEIASAHGAAGWKVNGAGGDGGSLTILGASDDGARAEMMRAILQDNPALRSIPISISRDGLTIW